jgi:DnaJ-class molecular chaperone
MEQYEEVECSNCAGSGEGMYDGTRCRSCRGKGVFRMLIEQPEEEETGE